MEPIVEPMDKSLRQRGFINFGGGLNREAWLADAAQEGYIVRDCGSYAELWSKATNAELNSGR